MRWKVAAIIPLVVLGSVEARAQSAPAYYFDPVPSRLNLTDAQKATLRATAIQMAAGLDGQSPDQEVVGDILFWAKASGGSILCIAMPPQAGRQVAYVAAISIASGPFATQSQLKKVYDNQTYNQYGCNMPGAIHL